MAKVRARMAPPKILAPGVYEGTIIDPEYIEDVAEGKYPYVKYTFVPADHEDDTVRSIFSMHPNALWVVQGALDALNIQYEVITEVDGDGNEVESLSFDSDDLAGVQCCAEIEHKMFNKRKQTAIKKITAPLE